MKTTTLLFVGFLIGFFLSKFTQPETDLKLSIYTPLEIIHTDFENKTIKFETHGGKLEFKTIHEMVEFIENETVKHADETLLNN